MSLVPPGSIERYVESINAADATEASLCFSTEARVLDEGEWIEGRPAIEKWITSTHEKYNHQTTPMSFVGDTNAGVLAAKVEGTFKGSPINLKFEFRLTDGLISELKIG